MPPWRLPHHINRADDAIMLADLHKPLPANFFVVAERQPAGAERLRAGFAFASTRWDYFTGQRHAHVEAMAVAKEEEGAGVAAALLQACEEWARSRGDEFVTLNVWMQNTRARDVCAPCPSRCYIRYHFRLMNGFCATGTTGWGGCLRLCI